MRVFVVIIASLAAVPAFCAYQFRTDINPALKYYQAFVQAPDLSEADHQYLFTREWRGQTLDRRFGSLIAKYDYQFRFLREAAGAQVPCDWGIDLTEGPDALLPALARAKAAAQATRLRVMWHLQKGRPDDARDDLLAGLVLARNVSHDGVLVSTMVEMAMENIVASVVAENFYQWQPDTLRQLADGMAATPARGTVADCIPAEKYSFGDWLIRKVTEIKAQSAGNDGEAVERLRELFGRVFGEEGDREFAANVIKAGGARFDPANELGTKDTAGTLVRSASGSIDGVVRLIGELAPLYDRATELMNLPQGPFEGQKAAFMQEVEKSSNPLVPKLFTVFAKCRTKEFATLVKLAMVRAGIEYKLRGEAGLKSVTDPCGNGPFTVRRFVVEGEDRGFELKSSWNGRGYDEVLIFVEKNGPPFRIDGKDAGRPIPPN